MYVGFVNSVVYCIEHVGFACVGFVVNRLIWFVIVWVLVLCYIGLMIVLVWCFVAVASWSWYLELL